MILQTTKVSHFEYADGIALTTSTAHHLQLQLDRSHTYTTTKGLMLNARKTKSMAFFCSNPTGVSLQWHSPWECARILKMGMTLGHNGKMTDASNQMARNFAGAIARVWRLCSELGIKNRKHAMLWIFYFQVFALCLNGCQVWATSTSTFDSSANTNAHIHHVCFLKMLLGVKRSTDTHDSCGNDFLLRETGQMPLSQNTVFLLVLLCCSLLEQPI